MILVERASCRELLQEVSQGSFNASEYFSGLYEFEKRAHTDRACKIHLQPQYPSSRPQLASEYGHTWSTVQLQAVSHAAEMEGRKSELKVVLYQRVAYEDDCNLRSHVQK